MKKVDVEGRVEGIDVEEEGELGLDKLLPGMLDRFHCYRNSLCVAPPERRCGTDLARSGLATVSVESSHRLLVAFFLQYPALPTTPPTV